MGTPLPPNKSDSICTICWGPGTKFHPQVQPRYIWAQAADIYPGHHWEAALEPLLLTPHILVQQDFPCFYVVDDDYFVWLLVFQGLLTEMRINHTASGTKAFWDVAAPRCSLDFADPTEDPLGRFGIAGTCHCAFDKGLL